MDGSRYYQHNTITYSNICQQTLGRYQCYAEGRGPTFLGWEVTRVTVY